MALTVSDAFQKFKSRLELTPSESKDVISKQTEVREHLCKAFSVDEDFLTGSYARHTKTRPLKDVDIFFVLNPEKEKKYINEPKLLLNDVRGKLIEKYGEDAVPPPNFRSVAINFTSDEDQADKDEKAMSIDVVPGFAQGNGVYKIPDMPSNGWIKSNPKIHADLTTKANEDFNGEWKPLVKMLKKWNETHDKVIKPSFFVEVMALDILFPPFSGGYVREIKSFLATIKERVDETWADPAGLGPDVSDRMDSALRQKAKESIGMTLKNIDSAIQSDLQGKTNDALRIWRDDVFGNKFPLS